MKVVELAPAKLNLTLDVGAKHHDGYHDITSVMTSAALCDVVTLESGMGEGITVSCSDPTLACDETNLAYRAAYLFFSHFGIACDGVHIHLEKNIPMQAGLGGSCMPPIWRCGSWNESPSAWAATYPTVSAVPPRWCWAAVSS